MGDAGGGSLMPLADVLSAMREIILDGPAFPEERGARLKAFKERFPKLAPEEAEDLAKIPADRFGVYTSTIFSGERSTLMLHFPLTFALLGRCWKPAYGAELDSFQLVRRLHTRYPWKSYASEELAENFVKFLAAELPEITSAHPEIPEAARLECLSLKVKRHPDTRAQGGSLLTAEELPKLVVAELLALSMAVPGSAAIERFSRGVTELQRGCRENGTLPEECRAEAEVSVIARNRGNYTRAVSVSPAVGSFLADVQKGRAATVGDLAEVCVSEADPGATEEEQFREFIRQFAELLELGAIVVERG